MKIGRKRPRRQGRIHLRPIQRVEDGDQLGLIPHQLGPGILVNLFGQNRPEPIGDVGVENRQHGLDPPSDRHTDNPQARRERIVLAEHFALFLW